MPSFQAQTLTPRASAHLDLIRGLAALAVLFGHVRGLFFLDYKDVASPSKLVTVIYGATGLGHQAVMVFFVLSGFFIGGSVLNAVHRWSWKHYLVNRVTRLYLVLLPALLLTAVIDHFAYLQPGGHTYFDLPVAHFNPTPIAPYHTWKIFLGNAAFLQTILVPTFGSNGPLWSLANEFWYYILFPACVLSLLSRARWKQRLWPALAAVALAVWLPGGILAGFAVWLMGAAIHLLPVWELPRGLRVMLLAVLWVVFAGVLAISRIQNVFGNDFSVGLAFALVLLAVLKIQSPRSVAAPAYNALAKMLSRCSYSVYAVHFPVVWFIRSSMGTRLWTPTLPNLALWTAVAFGVFLFGLLFSLITEAHTDTVRARILTLLGHRAVAPALSSRAGASA